MNIREKTVSGSVGRNLKGLFLLGTMPAVLAGVLMATSARADVREASPIVFYDAGTKSAATGRVDADGNFTILKTYVQPAVNGATTRAPIAYPPVTAVGTRGGSRWLLCPAGTGLYEPAGVFTDGSLEFNRGLVFNNWTHAVGLQNTGGLVFFYDANALVGTTGRFNDDLNFAPDGSRRNPDSPYVVDVSFTNLKSYGNFYRWTHVVGLNGGLLLFYNAQSAGAAVGRVRNDGTFTTLGYPAGLATWTNVVGVGSILDPGLILFWNANTGLATTGRVGADGSFTNLKGFRIDWPWTHVVGVFGNLEPGRVLLYDAYSGFAETVRVNSDGSVTPLKLYGDFPVWTHVIGDSQ